MTSLHQTFKVFVLLYSFQLLRSLRLSRPTQTARQWYLRSASIPWDDLGYEFGAPRWHRSMGTMPVYRTSNPLTSNDTRLLPIFPLDDGCTFPTGVFPLHIFAMPYRSMMNDIISAHDRTGAEKLFGICMSDGKGGVAEVGVGLEIVDRDLKPDGRQLVSTVCRQRFVVTRIVQEEPYIIAEVKYACDDVDVPNSDSPEEISDELSLLEVEIMQYLTDIIALSNSLQVYGSQKVEMPQKITLLSPKNHAIRKSVATLFSFAVSNYLNLDAKDKQILLQAPSLQARLKRLKALLLPSRDALLQKAGEQEENTLQ